MPLLESSYDFDNIVSQFEAVLSDVADGSRRPKSAQQYLNTLFASSFVFSTDPIGWHVSEIANRVAQRLDLNPGFATLVTNESVYELKAGEQQCTRSRISIERIEQSLILQLVGNTVKFGGRTAESRKTAEQILKHCPRLKPSPTPFVDDPPCKCRNCRITIE